jgi:hypothetical protein
MATKIIKDGSFPDYLPPMRPQFNAAAPMPVQKPRSDLGQMWDSVVTGAINPIFAMLNQAFGVTNSVTNMPWSQEDFDMTLLAAGIRPEQPKSLTDYRPDQMPIQFVEWDASIDAVLNNKPPGPKTPGM